MSLSIQRLASGRKSEIVARQIADLIVLDKLAPGDKLPSEPQLASQFGVSRGVLREAIRTLESSGFVEVRRGYGGGTFVISNVSEDFLHIPTTSLSLDGVDPAHLLDVRLETEPLAARLAARRSSGWSKGLRQVVRLAEEREHYPAQFLTAIGHFHVGVAELSGNLLLQEFATKLRPAIGFALRDKVEDPQWRLAVRADQQALVALIEAGDEAAAQQAMRVHIERTQS